MSHLYHEMTGCDVLYDIKKNDGTINFNHLNVIYERQQLLLLCSKLFDNKLSKIFLYFLIEFHKEKITIKMCIFF
jgi:hypothetical protein